MNKNIYVYSRDAVEDMDPHIDPHVIISINCPGEGAARIRTNRATLGRVNLFFWDLDRIPENGDLKYDGVIYPASAFKESSLCQPEDAKKVIDLVEAHPEAEDIIVHCTAGKSRSAAVAAALHKIYNGTDEPIFGNKRYHPNMRVYRMVLDEWHARQEK